MIFELVSWVYITIICLIWGNRILKLLLGVNNTLEIGFPLVCFVGMSVIGILSFYISLFIPLFTVVKLSLQIPALLVLLKRGARKEIFFQIKKPFIHLHASDFIFLVAALLMIFFLCTSPIIHPDTLNYHAFSSRVFEKYGTIPGIANLRLEFGFQSMWFAALAFFDFPFGKFGPQFILNSCVMAWVVVFLTTRGENLKSDRYDASRLSVKALYLLLTLFFILSWTQIRLTASSLSPDFITTISILLGFYFFGDSQNKKLGEKADKLAVFFSVIAISIKLSAIPVLLIPAFIFSQAIIRRRFFLARFIFLLTLLILIPIICRNVISTGYPFYPSSFAAIYPFDWKLSELQVVGFQQYITSYARYPIIRADALNEVNNSFLVWMPKWWRHLYMVDKAIMLFISLGVLLNLFLHRILRMAPSKRTMTAFIIAISGTVFWFINAPDPRFGTGFLIPVIYFLYSPIIKNFTLPVIHFLGKTYRSMVNFATALVLVYIGYRSVYFFHPRQVIFPEGIKNISSPPGDCDATIKKMVLDNVSSPEQLPDSCRFFRFRGTTVKQGFEPNR